MNLTYRVLHNVILTLELLTIFASFNVALSNSTNARNLTFISLSKLKYLLQHLRLEMMDTIFGYFRRNTTMQSMTW